ncbi:MAG: DUF1499 domain-containing protein [Gammaproteobacteria bacterium]
MKTAATSEASLTRLADLQSAPTRNSFRLAAPDSPRFPVNAGALWRAWLELTARAPRTRLIAKDSDERRSFHIQRSKIFRFPDLIRAEIVELETGASAIAIDSRARYGYSDWGVNERRVKSWIAELEKRVK